MRSTGGQYYQGLDHLRALAVFLVFSWHFLHFGDIHLQQPIGIAPLSLLTEGHTGVALFMVLSGYLFAKLLEGKEILFGAFLFNRALRLLPLLLVVIAIVSALKIASGEFSLTFIKSILKGFLYPTLPNGGWSITVEFHFYLLLPYLLRSINASLTRFLWLMALSLLLRLLIWMHEGEVQSLAYWTIIGRFDQFLLGIAGFKLRDRLRHKFWLALGLLTAFILIWRAFDASGGFYTMPSYPSPSVWWVFVPALEGVTYAALIVWYDSASTYRESFWSRQIAAIGTYSYSIYLLHFFFVFELPRFINRYIVDIESPTATLVALPFCFLIMIPIGWFSYRWIETPFLKRRKTYLRSPNQSSRSETNKRESFS